MEHNQTDLTDFFILATKIAPKNAPKIAPEPSDPQSIAIQSAEPPASPIQTKGESENKNDAEAPATPATANTTSPSKQLSDDAFAHDIPLKTAEAAYQHTSWTPDERGKSYIRDYIRQMVEFYHEFDTLAPEEREQFEQDFSRFRKTIIKYHLNYLHSHSIIASAAVVGPAKFPARQMEKRNNNAHNHLTKLIATKDKITKSLRKKYLTTPADLPIKSGESDTIQRLNEKIAELETLQTKWKAWNKILAKKTELPRKIALLKEAGFTATIPNGDLNYGGVPLDKVQGEQTEDGANYSHISHMGNLAELRPVRPFRLSNNSANLRRLRLRLEAETARIAAYTPQTATTDDLNIHSTPATPNTPPPPPAEKRYVIGPAEVVENVAINRIQIFFPSKPSDQMRASLKSTGFHWSPREGAWQRQLTQNAIYATKRLLEHPPD